GGVAGAPRGPGHAGGPPAPCAPRVEPLSGTRRRGTQRSPCGGRERPAVGGRLLLVGGLPRQSTGRNGGAGAGAGGRCSSRVQYRQLGGTVGIRVTRRWRRERPPASGPHVLFLRS